eukprot:5923678-Pyramimonas_sp.AAC.1
MPSRFPFRGVLLDSARHFLPVSAIKEVLDGMSYAKMNVFHWHMTDDESFPYISQALPDLASKGNSPRRL